MLRPPDEDTIELDVTVDERPASLAGAGYAHKPGYTMAPPPPADPNRPRIGDINGWRLAAVALLAWGIPTVGLTAVFIALDEPPQIARTDHPSTP